MISLISVAFVPYFSESSLHVRLSHKHNFWVYKVSEQIDEFVRDNISQFLELLSVDN